MSGDRIASLDAVDARGWGVRVVFLRVAPRIAHRIGLVTDAGVEWVLASVEGNSRQAFPPSPPLQQLATEVLDGGRTAALLLGMAGRNHWSVSAESHPPDRLVRVDVACRARVEDQESVHSVYQVLSPWQLSADATVAEWIGPGCCLRCVASSDADCATTLRMNEGRLVIGPARLGDASTHRWRYELVFAERLPTLRP